MILNAALALLFYICGHGFIFESSSIGNPQYAPEVLHQTPETFYIASHGVMTDGRSGKDLVGNGRGPMLVFARSD
jgi:hypothetical protein